MLKLQNNRAFVKEIEDMKHVTIRSDILNHILKVKNESYFEICEHTARLDFLREIRKTFKAKKNQNDKFVD